MVHSHCDSDCYFFTMSPFANKLFGALMCTMWICVLFSRLFVFRKVRDAYFSLTFYHQQSHCPLYRLKIHCRMFCHQDEQFALLFTSFSLSLNRSFCRLFFIRSLKRFYEKKTTTIELLLVCTRSRYNLCAWLLFELEFSHIISLVFIFYTWFVCIWTLCCC